MTLFIKVAIAITLLAIVVSLGSGLFFLMSDRSQSRRMLNAVTVRIALSVILFLLILLGLFTGALQPNPSPLS